MSTLSSIGAVGVTAALAGQTSSLLNQAASGSSNAMAQLPQAAAMFAASMVSSFTNPRQNNLSSAAAMGIAGLMLPPPGASVNDLAGRAMTMGIVSGVTQAMRENRTDTQSAKAKAEADEAKRIAEQARRDVEWGKIAARVFNNQNQNVS